MCDPEKGDTSLNLWEFPEKLPQEELLQTLWAGNGVRVERIVSMGQVSPAGFWYDQDEEEWLAVLEGEAVLRFEDREQTLKKGDTCWIPAHERHRVEFTSAPCLWLCVFVPSQAK